MRAVPLLAFALAAGPCGALAQTQERHAPAEFASRITLRAASAFPGGELAIPIELNTRDAVRVTRVAFTTDIPEGTRFTKAAPSYPVEEAKGAADASIVTGGGTQRVAVRFAAAQGSLPDGVIGYLVFAVSRGAAPGPRTIAASGAVIEGPEGVPIEPAGILARGVSIVDRKSVPIVSCFFYMH